LRERSGQGEVERPDLINGYLERGAEVRTRDLSLFIPKPETTEKEEITERAGKMEGIESVIIAKSSAKAK
jgi:hypothetical protein